MRTHAEWVTSAKAVNSWSHRTGMQGDRMAILSAVWDKEMGHLARHWKLQGIRGGILYISPQSSSAALELQVRGREILRGLNKYFRTAWIKGIRSRMPAAHDGRS